MNLIKITARNETRLSWPTFCAENAQYRSTTFTSMTANCINLK